MKDYVKKTLEAMLWAAAAALATQLSTYFSTHNMSEIAAILVALAAWLRRSPRQ